MTMAYCELLLQNSLSLLYILGKLSDENQGIAYLPTSFFIKNDSQNLLRFLRLTTKYSNILGKFKNGFL